MQEYVNIQDFIYNSDIVSLESLCFTDDLNMSREIVVFVKTRPMKIGLALDLCAGLIKKSEIFKDFLIMQSMIRCPIIFYKLFEMGYISFPCIEPYILEYKSLLPSLYFFSHISDIKIIKNFRDVENVYRKYPEIWNNNPTLLNELINFGFPLNSIEYIIKYDDCGNLKNRIDMELKDYKIEWSPFEWSYQCRSSCLLGFAAHFGSLRCFRLLMLNGFVVNDFVIMESIFGGSFDIVHLLPQNYTIKHLEIASQSCQAQIYNWIVENSQIENEMVFGLLFKPIILFIIDKKINELSIKYLFFYIIRQ